MGTIPSFALPQKQKPATRAGFLKSGAGLGIISTIKVLFVIGFIGISRKQRPHEGPHKKSLWFCDGYHEKSLFCEWDFAMCGVPSTICGPNSTHNGSRSTYNAGNSTHSDAEISMLHYVGKAPFSFALNIFQTYI